MVCPPTTEWGNCTSHWVSNCKTLSNDQTPKTQTPWKDRKATRLTGLDWRASTHKINMVSVKRGFKCRNPEKYYGKSPGKPSCPAQPVDDVLVFCPLSSSRWEGGCRPPPARPLKTPHSPFPGSKFTKGPSDSPGTWLHEDLWHREVFLLAS